MNTRIDSLAGDQGATVRGLYRAVLATMALILLSFALYWQTLWSMVEIWWRSETFAHGFLILPISIWLIWRQRASLAVMVPRPDRRGLLVLALLGLGWLLAQVADVQVVQQLTFVAMIPVLVVTCLGWAMAHAILFPLLFLFFAVPMGEGLIPPLMDFTAVFTVHALRLSGIPVFSEGTFFSIPSGDWSVVEGCSGVRYLIASVTMGSLYAYLSYRSYWRRTLFILIAIALPIVANGMRAYMIVMIAHLSDMKLAMGVDHYIYGWVFFGFVMLLLFWIGSWWSETEESQASAMERLAAGQQGAAVPKALVPVLSIGLVLLLIWPVWLHFISEGRAAVMTPPVQLAAPPVRGDWNIDVGTWTDWSPRYVAPDTELQTGYRRGQHPVGLYLAHYARQRQGAELVNSQNVMVIQKHPKWRQVEQRLETVELAGRSLQVHQTRLMASGQNLLIWHWYWLDGTHTANDYWAKLIEARQRLLGGAHPAVGVVVYTPYDHDKDGSEQQLRDFLADMLPAIEAGLHAASVP